MTWRAIGFFILAGKSFCHVGAGDSRRSGAIARKATVLGGSTPKETRHEFSIVKCGCGQRGRLPAWSTTSGLRPRIGQVLIWPASIQRFAAG